MKWQIPAKTFLLGEYAALAEGSAIILTTSPYFELSLSTTNQGLSGIHPESPAGIWWQQQNINKGLSFYDPYSSRGGLGASSAQFLGTYLACCQLNNKLPDLQEMLAAYYHCSWSGVGLKPSGYDAIAQSQKGCVYINKQSNTIKSYQWPFTDLSLLLIHSGVKLATHQHLQATTLPTSINQLSAIVEQAKQAFEQVNGEQLIKAINDYHQEINDLNRVAQHSLDIYQTIKSIPRVY